MVLGKLVGKIKEKVREERIAREAEKKLKKLEEQRKIEKEYKKLKKLGLSDEEAKILAKKRAKAKKGSTLDKVVDAVLGPTSSGKKSRKGKKSRNSSRSVLDDLDRHFKELESVAGLSSGGRRRKGKSGGIEDIDFWRLMQV